MTIVVKILVQLNHINTYWIKVRRKPAKLVKLKIYRTVSQTTIRSNLQPKINFKKILQNKKIEAFYWEQCLDWDYCDGHWLWFTWWLQTANVVYCYSKPNVPHNVKIYKCIKMIQLYICAFGYGRNLHMNRWTFYQTLEVEMFITTSNQVVLIHRMFSHL